jgi:hypothetical protein
MNWAQENKTLAGIVGVMVAGGLGLGVWLYLSWSGYSEAREAWDTTRSKIDTINNKKLSPTAPNVERRERELGEYADKVNQLRGALLSVQQAPKPITETDFQAKLKERATAMKALARTLGMRELPEDFALGFDKYATQPPRSPQVAAELNVHLDAIEKLITTCIEGGVTQIQSIDRAKLPDEEAPAPPKATTAAAKTKKAPTKKGGKQVKTVITEQAAAEPVLDRYPIKLRLLTDQAPFQTVVNTLCHPGKMPHFLVVRLIRVENEKMMGPTKEEMKTKQTQAQTGVTATTAEVKPTEPPKPDAPRMLPVPKPATPDVFDIMGGELLNVYLEVDYIRFRPAAALEEEEAVPPSAAPSAPAASAAK